MRRGLALRFNLTGHWTKTVTNFKTLPRDTLVATSLAHRNFGRRLERRVKRHMRNQDLPWAPLAKSTLYHRRMRGNYGTGALMDTQAYYHAIKVWQSSYVVYVGVPRDAGVNKRGVPIAVYAALQETGTKRIPARPLWEPSFSEMGGSAAITSETKAYIEKAYRLKGWNIRWR